MDYEKQLEALLDQHKADDAFLNSLNYEEELNPAIKGIANNRTFAQIAKIQGGEDHDFDLGDIFKPIPANPNVPARRKLIRETFVFCNEGRDRPASKDYQPELPINYDYATLASYVEECIDLAKEVRKNHIRRDSTKQRSVPEIQCVVGNKGVGKTHLQNYIICEFKEKFDRENTLWIRLNLTKNFGSEDDNIDFQRWVNAQVTKVLCRYYNKNMKSEFVRRFDERATENSGISSPLVLRNYDFWKVIESHYLEGIKEIDGYYEFVDRAVAMYGRLTKKQLDNKDIDPSWMLDSLCQSIFEFALNELELNLIVVFDGIDLLSQSTVNRERYKRVEKALVNYLTNETKNNFFTLLFIRKSTLLALQKYTAFLQRCQVASSEMISYKTVATCCAREIYRKRLDFQVGSKKLSPEVAEAYQEFIQKTGSGLYDSGKELSIFEALQSIGGSDTREVSQLMSIATQGFRTVGTEETKKYLLIEESVLGDREYPSSTYFYDYRNGEPQRITDLNHYSWETLYLPSILNFPYCISKKGKDIFTNNSLKYFCWGFNLIKAVQLYQEINNEIPDASEIQNFLQEYFGFQREMTGHLIEEYVEYDIFDADYSHNENLNKGIDVEDRIHRAKIRLRPKGQYLIRSCLDDLSYLGLYMMSLPIPLSLYNKILFSNSIVKLRSPRTSAANPLPWVVAKIFNAFSARKILNRSMRDAAIELNVNRSVSTMKSSKWDNVLTALSKIYENLDKSIEIKDKQLVREASKAIAGLKYESQKIDAIKELDNAFNSLDQSS